MTTEPVSLDVELYYKDSGNQAADNIVQQAFQEAVQYFSTELTQDEVERRWIAQRTSIADVLAVVQEAQAKYAATKSNHGRFCQLAMKLSESLLFYASVIDVFVQIHPEYSALAWGAVKFVLLVRPSRSEGDVADYSRASLNMQSCSQRYRRPSFSWARLSRKRTSTVNSTRPAS